MRPALGLVDLAAAAARLDRPLVWGQVTRRHWVMTDPVLRKPVGWTWEIRGGFWAYWTVDGRAECSERGLSSLRAAQQLVVDRLESQGYVIAAEGVAA